jgi:hypothetical protein
MSTPTIPLRFLGTCTLAACWAVSAGAVLAAPAADTLDITVHPDRYVVGGRSIDDLNRLEAAVQALAPQSLRLRLCEVPATRAFKAAVHRLSALPLKTLVLDSGDPECRTLAQSPLQRVSDRPGRALQGIDDDAVERYWNGLMP